VNFLLDFLTLDGIKAVKLLKQQVDSILETMGGSMTFIIDAIKLRSDLSRKLMQDFKESFTEYQERQQATAVASVARRLKLPWCSDIVEAPPPASPSSKSWLNFNRTISSEGVSSKPVSPAPMSNLSPTPPVIKKEESQVDVETIKLEDFLS